MGRLFTLVAEHRSLQSDRPTRRAPAARPDGTNDDRCERCSGTTSRAIA
ncbi:hypothetical protein A33M_3986 [Rhodovulum sp. PH10]|nr:hypothetical protein A33M_3986 [Rhodovulum sp. PH10]